MSYFKVMNKSEIKKHVKTLERKFYCYALLDNGIPFYIGIGSNPQRVTSHTTQQGGKNNFKTNKIEKIQSEGREIQYCIISSFHSWLEACHAERSLILFYGRRNIRPDGLLTNLTDGGDGTPGRVVSEKVRKGMSERGKGVVQSEETKRKKSESLKEYYRNNPNPCLGKKLSIEHRQKLSEKKKGENHPAYGKFGKDNPKYGSKVSEEGLKNMKEAQSKYSHNHSEETIEKIRASQITRAANQNKETKEVSK